MSKPESLPIAEELRRRGIRPSRRLGQNFMVDRNLLDFLVRTAGVGAHDVVLEVGTGAGFLTERLCVAAEWVISVEIDSGLYGLAAERLADFSNLTLIHGDALAGGRAWSPAVSLALMHAIESRPTSALKLVANLPYSVATTVLQVTLESDLPFAGAWFTCQKEVAERIMAKPGSADYGFVSVLVALTAEARVVRHLPPSVFWPRPQVDSAIVEIIPSAAKRAEIGDFDALRRFISALFTYRRKTLRAALRHLGIDRCAILRLDTQLAEMGVSTDSRISHLEASALKKVAEALTGDTGLTGGMKRDERNGPGARDPDTAC